jgi:hypothetical protein
MYLDVMVQQDSTENIVGVNIIALDETTIFMKE